MVGSGNPEEGELRPAARLRNQRGRVALSRGPLVYCLESIDNPDIDIFKTKIDLQSVHVENEPNMLGGIRVLRGKTSGGQDFTAIPYHLWANRGKSTMTVWLKG